MKILYLFSLFVLTPFVSHESAQVTAELSTSGQDLKRMSEEYTKAMVVVAGRDFEIKIEIVEAKTTNANGFTNRRQTGSTDSGKITITACTELIQWLVANPKALKQHLGHEVAHLLDDTSHQCSNTECHPHELKADAMGFLYCILTGDSMDSLEALNNMREFYRLADIDTDKGDGTHPKLADRLANLRKAWHLADAKSLHTIMAYTMLNSKYYLAAAKEYETLIRDSFGFPAVHHNLALAYLLAYNDGLADILPLFADNSIPTTESKGIVNNVPDISNLTKAKSAIDNYATLVEENAPSLLLLKLALAYANNDSLAKDTLKTVNPEKGLKNIDSWNLAVYICKNDKVQIQKKIISNSVKFFRQGRYYLGWEGKTSINSDSIFFSPPHYKDHKDIKYEIYLRKQLKAGARGKWFKGHGLVIRHSPPLF